MQPKWVSFFYNFGAAKTIEPQAVSKPAALGTCVVSLELSSRYTPCDKERKGNVWSRLWPLLVGHRAHPEGIERKSVSASVMLVRAEKAQVLVLLSGSWVCMLSSLWEGCEFKSGCRLGDSTDIA